MDDTLQKRIVQMRWALPVSFAVLAVFYQLVLASWVHDRFGDSVHYGVEVVFYAGAGPLLAFWALGLIGRWLNEKELAENQARASDRRLAAITSASADSIISLDTAGRVEAFNLGAELLFGTDGEEMQGRYFQEMLGRGRSGRSEFEWLLEEVQDSGYVQGHEAECNINGRRITVELTATRLSDDAGSTAGFSLIMRDVTARRERENEIRRLNEELNELVSERTQQLSEKVEELARANTDLQRLDEMRSEFVSLVSHQIRAPLTNIRGAVERIHSDCGNHARADCSRMFGIVSDQTSRLDRLVTTVLNASLLESEGPELHVEPVSLIPLVRRVVSQFQTRTRHRPIMTPATPSLPAVFADPVRTEEILTNLLDNADKHSPAGAPVEITLRADVVETVVSVRDHGPGIPNSDLTRIFERFYRIGSGDAQTAYGYGLGLYVCRRLVEAQRGRIWAENHPDGGAILSFSLPAPGPGKEPPAVCGTNRRNQTTKP